jgi:hypothetical protein
MTGSLGTVLAVVLLQALAPCAAQAAPMGWTEVRVFFCQDPQVEARLLYRLLSLSKLGWHGSLRLSGW